MTHRLIKELFLLQTLHLPLESVKRLAEIETVLWSRAKQQLQDHAVQISDAQRLRKLGLLLDDVQSGIEYYSQLSLGYKPAHFSRQQPERFATNELTSYNTDLEIIRKSESWAREQGLLFKTDSVTIDSVTYFRILSIPVLSTQTSKAGVVFRPFEIIDIPHRKIPSVAKTLERADDFAATFNIDT